MASSSSSSSAFPPEKSECRAHDTDTNEECDCTDFRELKKTGLCADCLHSRASHHKPSASNAKRVQGILTGMLKNPSTSGSTTLSKIAQSRALSSGSSRTRAANAESNRGMRPTGKGKGKEKSTSNPNLFKVVSVVVIACGTQFIDGILQVPPEFQEVPDKVKIQTLVLNGLAVLRDEKGIEFDRTSDHVDFTNALREALPLPFESGEDEDAPPPWHLAAAVKRRLKIVPVTFPAGSDADYNKGANTTGFRNNRIWIVSRQPIPDEILESWVAPEGLAFRNSAGTRSHDVSDSEVASPSPEPASRRSKRSAVASHDEEPAKKKRKKSSSGSKDLEFNLSDTDNVSGDILGGDSGYIDLTADDPPSWSRSRSSTPAFLRALTPPPKPNTIDPAFSDGFKVDPTMGDPYAPGKTYTF
ncbi:hypothetical protein B0H11DRAFT_2189687 [Mycena galericulata]|nr:hypothetical protein B0H11DRAFT_2189687 [Mycena galericulata]